MSSATLSSLPRLSRTGLCTLKEFTGRHFITKSPATVVSGRGPVLHARFLSSFSIHRPMLASINSPLMASAHVSVLSDHSTRAIATFVSNAPKSFLLRFPSRALHSSTSLKDRRLKTLETRANQNPDDPSTQAAFLGELLENHPDFVVKRYEQGSSATNDACEAIYQEALRRVGRNIPRPMDSSYGGDPEITLPATASLLARMSSSSRNSRDIAAGVKGNPLHVVVDEGPGSTLLKWLRFILSFALTCFFIFFLASLMEETTGLLKQSPSHGEVKSMPTASPVRFSDVKGVDEAKEELEEVVMFLKDPTKFTSLGGKLPKGILLTGPPGTGKTMLARAVAGEANVPFFFMSGSEFDEMYVGVGAKRMRELFASARAKAPAIIFIDEIDAVGARRNPRDSHYVKQTLNQFLVELDGFQQSSGIIVIGATNFPQLLDKALVRPGRFDKTVEVPLPDVRGRLQILQQHAKNVAIGQDVDFKLIARSTTGFSGADLANLVNEAAVRGSRERARVVTMAHFEWAKDKITMGHALPHKVKSLADKTRTAYHEGGHALVALLNENSFEIEKATILPRSKMLGHVAFLPPLDKWNLSRAELLARMDGCVAGRVAEEVAFGLDSVESGAASDFQQLMSIARAFVLRCGFSDKVGYYYVEDDDLSRLSTKERTLFDSEVRSLIEQSTQRVRDLLRNHRLELERIKEALLEFETLTGEELKKIVKGEKIRVQET